MIMKLVGRRNYGCNTADFAWVMRQIADLSYAKSWSNFKRNSFALLAPYAKQATAAQEISSHGMKKLC